jgi:hypothetical protein
MQRIMVDLPEPEGPQMTMRSPRSTFRLMSRSTWKSPYHLLTPAISTAVSLGSGALRTFGRSRAETTFSIISAS